MSEEQEGRFQSSAPTPEQGPYVPAHEFDLSALVDKALSEERQEKEMELYKKVRHLVGQLEYYKTMGQRAEAEVKKFQKKHAETEDKLRQIRKGGLDILKSVKLEEKP